jgi:hypothetical protein
VTIEYMIMIPLLILQIFIFPFAATVIMNTWTDSRRNLELEEIAGHLGSSIQQLYYTINHASISSGSLTANLDTPIFIDGHAFNITLRDASNSNAVKIMNITLNLQGTNNVASSLITLGDKAAWQENSVFLSYNISVITATKTAGSIWLSFNGDN